MAAFLVPFATAQEVPRDYYVEISKGNIPGHELVVVNGIDGDIGTTTYLIWGEDAYVFPVAAILMNVSSSSANDDNGNTGAWNVTIYGLDTNWDRINETVVMDGQNPVPTTLQYRRINMMRTQRVGTNLRNVGNIYIGVGATVAGEPATIYNKIPPEIGQSQTALYTVPDGKTAFVTYFHFGTDTTKIIELSMEVRYEDCPDNGWVTTYHDHFQLGHITHNLPMPFPVTEKSDIGIFARNSVGSAFASVDIFIALIDNDVLHNSSLDWGDGSPGEVVISQPIDVNIVESIDLMSTEFFVFITIATITMYIAWNTENNRNAGLGFAFSAVFWIATMIQWARDHVGTNEFGMMWLFIVPLSFCFIMFSEKSWHQMDDATENIRKGRTKF